VQIVRQAVNREYFIVEEAVRLKKIALIDSDTLVYKIASRKTVDREGT
jgi:hypothetical protein